MSPQLLTGALAFELILPGSDALDAPHKVLLQLLGEGGDGVVDPQPAKKDTG